MTADGQDKPDIKPVADNHGCCCGADNNSGASLAGSGDCCGKSKASACKDSLRFSGTDSTGRKKLTIALAGNPNCGKTTVFNALTGSDQVVGNWSGVTVQRLAGHYHFEDVDVTVIDLPGVYSLGAGSLDETVARDYLRDSRPDVIINVIDGSNLQRNLYLTAQLLEMSAPVIVALNMMDVVKRRGMTIDVDHLQEHLNCPVIAVTASRSSGIDHLKREINSCDKVRFSRVRVSYDSEVEEALAALVSPLSGTATALGLDARWMALKLLERDEHMTGQVDSRVDSQADEFAREISQHVGDDISMVIADGRYGFARGLSRDVVRQTLLNRRRVSDIADKIILNKVLCLPIFAAVMYLMFSVTISLSAPFVDFFDSVGSAVLVEFPAAVLQHFSAPSWLTVLLADGLGGGITTVATFVPPITMIFMCLSILADSGYMARAAFVMDRVLRPLGLPGKAFLPMLVGFGCNVPGILATRVLEDPRDRIMAILANPFMSCGARLPVYTFLAVTFFSAQDAGLVVFSLYALGIIIGLLTTFLLGRTLLPGETSSFVMELPPYHCPTVRGVFHHTWNNLKDFVVRAGKVIILVVVVLSLITGSGDSGAAVPSDQPQAGGDAAEMPAAADAPAGLLGRAAATVTPVFAPMGISEENWPAVVALFSGVFAKEAVVGSLSALYEHMPLPDEQGGNDVAARMSASDEIDADPGIAAAFGDMLASVGDGFVSLGRGLLELFIGSDEGDSAPNSHLQGVMSAKFGSKAAAIAYLTFVLLYVPCIAVVAAIYQEIGLWWASFSVAYQMLIAWVVATIVYQSCQLLVSPPAALAWLGLCALILIGIYAAMKIAARRTDVFKVR